MRIQVLKLELALVVLFLAAIVFRPLFFPDVMRAQSPQLPNSIYIEPGVTMLRAPDGSRNVLGKVMIDLSTGDIWGFPTTSQEPYPMDVNTSKPPTSKPFRLGRFDFSALAHQ